MMKKLIIFGTSYLDVIKVVDAINREKPTWEVLGFINDLEEFQGRSFLDYPVLGTRDIIERYCDRKDVYFINNISRTTADRFAVGSLMDSYGCRYANLIHPRIDTKYSEIGTGCIMPEGTTIGGQTIIGDHVLTRLNTTVSHDVEIGNYVYIGPGATVSGNAKVRDRVLIGAGATILFNRTVGEDSTVGAGAVVTKDVAPGVTVVGNPARQMKKPEPSYEGGTGQ